MKKQPRKKNKNNKSLLDINSNDLKEYASQIPEVIFLIIMIYVGVSIYTNPQKNFMYQKYLKKSIIQGRKYIDYYFPGLLANEKIFNIFDYDILLTKTRQILLMLSIIYIIGAVFLLIFTSSSRKIIIFISLLLDLILVHNLNYYREEKLFGLIKTVAYIIVLIWL